MRKKRKTQAISQDKLKDFKKAEKSLEKMCNEIKPFIKKRSLKQTSTADKWCETSSSCFLD